MVEQLLLADKTRGNGITMTRGSDGYGDGEAATSRCATVYDDATIEFAREM
jgi:hypothetical protein